MLLAIDMGGLTIQKKGKLFIIITIVFFFYYFLLGDIVFAAGLFLILMLEFFLFRGEDLEPEINISLNCYRGGRGVDGTKCSFSLKLNNDGDAIANGFKVILHYALIDGEGVPNRLDFQDPFSIHPGKYIKLNVRTYYFIEEFEDLKVYVECNKPHSKMIFFTNRTFQFVLNGEPLSGIPLIKPITENEHSTNSESSKR